MTSLTDHEMDVLLAYARLGTYAAVAEEFGISRHTVRNLLAEVRSKLVVDTTIQALWVVTTGEAA